MHIKKYKILVYIISFFMVLSLFIPVVSYGIDTDSIYVWSNSSSSVSTSSTSTDDSEDETAEDNSRKFFRHNFWKCNSYGAKYW